MPSREERVLAVLRAARKRLAAPVEHETGIHAEGVAEIDRLLKAGEDELSEVVAESGEREPIPATTS